EVGVPRSAMMSAGGTSWCNSCSRFAASSTFRVTTPVRNEIASRSAEAGDQTKLDRVAAGIEDDWNRSGCCPCREHRSSVHRDNDGHLTTNQFGRHRWQPIISALRPAVFDRHVPALDIARFLQALTECIQHGPVSVERCAVEKPDHRQSWLLRLRRERPCGCCAAEKRDELAPLHQPTQGWENRPSALRPYDGRPNGASGT